MRSQAKELIYAVLGLVIIIWFCIASIPIYPSFETECSFTEFKNICNDNNMVFPESVATNLVSPHFNVSLKSRKFAARPNGYVIDGNIKVDNKHFKCLIACKTNLPNLQSYFTTTENSASKTFSHEKFFYGIQIEPLGASDLASAEQLLTNIMNSMTTTSDDATKGGNT